MTPNCAKAKKIRPVGPSEKGRDETDPGRPRDVRNQNQGVARRPTLELPAVRQKPGAHNGPEARDENDLPGSNAGLRKDEHRNEHDIKRREKSAVGRRRRGKADLLQSGGGEDAKADKAGERQIALFQRRATVTALIERQRRERGAGQEKTDADEGDRPHKLAGVFLRDKGRPPDKSRQHKQQVGANTAHNMPVLLSL